MTHTVFASLACRGLVALALDTKFGAVSQRYTAHIDGADSLM